MIRRSLALVLALVLAASSVTMAVARGQTRIAGEVVICSGYGLTTISVDAAGNPVDSVHICPDMVLAMFAAPEAAPLVLRAPEGRVDDLVPAEPLRLSSLARVETRARGPPGLV